MSKTRITFLFAIAVVIFGALAYRQTGKPRDPVRDMDSTLPTTSSASKPTNTLLNLALPSPTRRAPLPAAKKMQSTQPASPSNPHAVEFKIVEGFAVAYGDIILGKPEEGSNIEKGFSIPPAPQHWDRTEIPYLISPDLPNPGRVEKALEYLKKNTIVQMVPYQGQKDAIIFEPGTEHCLSALGKIGGIQPIKLSESCQTPEVLHEILHALGFIHEQSRPDRDQFIRIEWQNIEQKYQSQFAIVPETLVSPSLKDTAFDYQSVMLYAPTAFAAKPGLFTLKSIGADPVNPVRDGLSEGDIKRVNRLYNW